MGFKQALDLFVLSPCAPAARATTWHRFIAVDIFDGIYFRFREISSILWSNLFAYLFAVMSADDDSTLSDTIIDKLAPTTADGIPLV